MSGSLEQSGNLKPTYARDQETLWREIRKLWAGVNNRSKGTIKDVPFVLAGRLYASISPRYYMRSPSVLQRVLVSLDTPGSTNTVVTLYKNGDALTTVALGGATDKTQIALTASFEADSDYLQVGITTAGTGAKDIDVQCRIMSYGD